LVLGPSHQIAGKEFFDRHLHPQGGIPGQIGKAEATGSTEHAANQIAFKEEVLVWQVKGVPRIRVVEKAVRG
jgi:hypothetical protein